MEKKNNPIKLREVLSSQLENKNGPLNALSKNQRKKLAVTQEKLET